MQARTGIGNRTARVELSLCWRCLHFGSFMPARKTLPHRRAVVGLSCAFRIDQMLHLPRVDHLTARRFACAFRSVLVMWYSCDLYRLVMTACGGISAMAGLVMYSVSSMASCYLVRGSSDACDQRAARYMVAASSQQ